MKSMFPFALAFFACAAPTVSAQYILAVESTNQRVLLLSKFDGSVVNPNYIDLGPAGAQTPIEAGIVNDEIWVSDQGANKLMKFTLDGTTYLGDLTGPLDNIRGFAYANGDIYLANFLNGNGAPGEAIVHFTLAGGVLGSWPSPSPWDVIKFNGELLVSDGLTDDLIRYDYAGNFLGYFATSDGVTGIDNPEQMVVRSNGNVLATNLLTPRGIYEYSPTGTQLNYWSVGVGNRGVAELGNGLLLWTDTAGIHTFDPVGLTTADILTGISARFVTDFAGSGTTSTPYCSGDGTDTACPCTNPGSAGRGCDNTVASGGARLTSTLFASIAADSLVLKSTFAVPFGPGLYYEGSTTANPTAPFGVTFGNGLRCAGGATNRLEIRFADAAGAANTTVSLSAFGAAVAGNTYNYQLWYRDTGNVGSCTPGAGFNFSNAISLTWTP